MPKVCFDQRDLQLFRQIRTFIGADLSGRVWSRTDVDTGERTAGYRTIRPQSGQAAVHQIRISPSSSPNVTSQSGSMRRTYWTARLVTGPRNVRKIRLLRPAQRRPQQAVLTFWREAPERLAELPFGRVDQADGRCSPLVVNALSIYPTAANDWRTRC